MSYAGLKPSFTSATTTAAMTAGTGITAPTGDVVASVGAVSAATTVTGGTGITATTGNITASGGLLSLNRSASVGGQIDTLYGSLVLHAIQGGGYTSGDNFYFGGNAGNATATGSSNLGLGASVLSALTSSFQNLGVGSGTLSLLTSGSGGNVGVGFNNLSALLTGANNTTIGKNAGSNYVGAESNNILISNAGTAAENAAIHIGTGGTHTTCFIAGIFGATVGGSGIPVNVDNAGQLGTVVSSIRFKENVQDIAEIPVLQLRPVTFTYKAAEDKSLHYGLIAEEVEKVMPDLVVYDDKKQPMSVKYHELPAILLAEIQRLQKRIEVLEQKA